MVVKKKKIEKNFKKSTKIEREKEKVEGKYPKTIFNSEAYINNLYEYNTRLIWLYDIDNKQLTRLQPKAFV